VTSPPREADVPAAAPAALRPALARYPAPLNWFVAVVQTARPRQWPKNLLVLAAPLAGASLGRDDGLLYALAAAAAFVAASAAVYFVNDVMDAERDRQHPAKRFRAVASGRLPKAHALAMAALGILVSLAVGFWIREPRLSAVIGAYLAFSVLYSAKLKHVPVVELVFVAAGFVLRALGGAIATHVPPSAWFLLVCSLGALMVAIAKRYTELAALDGNAARHRPVMRWYTPAKLRLSQRVVAGAMILAYLLWATAERDSWMAGWHLASAVALSLALVRFDQLTGNAQGRPVEDLISRDRQMNVCELAWLIMFAVGL
jgi:decaprenyl-phosphate phosphoribosyltransferase